MGNDYLWMSEEEIQKHREQARRTLNALHKYYLAQFKRNPMQFIRSLLDAGYTDNMINDIIKSFEFAKEDGLIDFSKLED